MAMTKRRVLKFSVALLMFFIVAAGVGLFYWKDTQKEVQSIERAEHLAEQHRIFSEWYALYQKDVDDLSRNWQLYHHIIDTFKAEDIDLYSCHERLSRLMDDEKLLSARIDERNLPPELDEFLYEKSRVMRDKIRAYSSAQYRTIERSVAAADPSTVHSELQAEQSRDIQEIMIRESPTGLFIADEVYAVREYLAVNEEFSDG